MFTLRLVAADFQIVCAQRVAQAEHGSASRNWSKMERRCMMCEHEPDWNTVNIQHDGGEDYVDVNCKKCGESGCVGSLKTLEKNIQWESDDDETKGRVPCRR